MEPINKEKLILEKNIFIRTEIEKRMADGGFNSLSRFELFIWDLEIFLQLQKKLGDKIILNGGAATQFYVPVSSQRTSIDIDMICLASHEEVHQVINEIENDLSGAGDYFKFRLYEPKNPKLGLDALETYFQTVPSICNELELFATKGKQEVKIEFIFSRDEHVFASDDFNLAQYSNVSLQTIPSEEMIFVELQCHNALMNDMIEKFRMCTDIIPVDDEHFLIKVKACVGPKFFQWVFGYDGLVRINQPETVRSKYMKMLRNALSE